MARVSYTEPWWVNLLHRLPHFSLCWEPTSSQFWPKDPDCQQALLLLGAAALACLALDLLFLLLYSFWLCCWQRRSEEHLDADCCCTAWCVVIATLVCSAGIAVGFCGNGETSNGVHRATYSPSHANRTVAGVQDHVWDTTAALNLTAEPRCRDGAWARVAGRARTRPASGTTGAGLLVAARRSPPAAEGPPPSPCGWPGRGGPQPGSMGIPHDIQTQSTPGKRREASRANTE